MGVGESLKEIYYNWEEKWYDLLDKIDSHAPIYKVIDPIDQVFPSFALFLILFFILILLLTLGLFGFVGNGQATLTLTVVTETGEKINGAEITINDGTEKYYSNQYGLVKPITVQLGKEISVKVKKDTAINTAKIYVGKTQEKAEIVLKGYGIELMEAKTMTFIDEQDLKITNDKLTLNFECSTGEAPVEKTKDVYNGIANVDVKASCGNLLVTVISEKYERKSVTLVNPSTTIKLALLVPTETGKAIVKIKDKDGNTINESITVQAFRATNPYSAAETKASINGEAIFDLPEGEYKFKTIAGSGYKVSEMSTIYNINKKTPTTIEIKLEKSFIGLIKVITKIGNNVASGVNVVLMKGTSQIEAKTTNTNGYTEFEAADVGPFNVYATKDGYCESIVSTNAPADINITLKSNTGSCGGKLTAKVVDGSGKPVVFAKVIIFGEKEDDEYKTTYIEKLTDYNGVVSWNPVNYTKEGEKYKVFAFKGAYSGWSIAKEFKSTTETEEFNVKLDIPMGKVSIIVKDAYGAPVTGEDGEPVYVQLFGDYDNSKVTGQRIIEGTEGKITIETKAGRKVYAVIRKEGYETYTTIPKLMIGNGQITFNVTLSKPPVEKIQIRLLGLYKNDTKALTVQAGQEYLALFELIAPIEYEELGFFVRVGKDTYTKTELDNMFIKEMVGPGVNNILTGATYNKPKGNNIDSQYLNLEQSKWGQITWEENDYAPGKIIVGAIIKIKENAKDGSDTIGYRAWGVKDGSYDRHLTDDVLGTSQSNSTRQELYAATIEHPISIGTESLCEELNGDQFCISSSYTDLDGFTTEFDTSFEARNNSLYKLNIKAMNNSGKTFDSAATKVENEQENLYLGDYTITKPREGIVSGTINGYESAWIETNDYSSGTSVIINPLNLTPRSIGSGDLKLRIRNDSKIALEKIFNIYVISDKKMKVEYMYLNEFQNDVPKLVSGKMQPITVKVYNTANNVEIENALVKLYDRFGTKLAESSTNKVGIATIDVPSALPSEKLTIKIEKPEYETYVKEIIISEDVITVSPTELSYTLNPQTKESESKTIKVENKTGLDLEIKSIKLTGKMKGKIAESKTETALGAYDGKIIKADDFEELELKVFIASDVTVSDDLEGKFEITVGNGYNEWVKEINGKIRIGLGKDVDDPNCLELSQTTWNTTTEGEEVQVGFNLTNNCAADSKLVVLKNLGAKDETTSSLGSMSVQSTNAYAELSRNYTKTFRTTLEAGETIPITLTFTPFSGTNGTATGSIVFEAKNPTDSKDQVISTSLEYTIEAVNLNECVVIGSDLVEVEEESTGSFTITNNCTKQVDFTIKDTKLTLSDKIFSIAANGTKDVTITRNVGEIPGMYNILIKGREGSSREKILGNVKVFFPAADSCIELTRYEYDVYNSQYEDYDGEDTGYLKNKCTEKVITVKVSGEEPYDKSRVWQQALIGAVIGFFKSDCDSFMGRLLGEWDIGPLNISCDKNAKDEERATLKDIEKERNKSYRESKDVISQYAGKLGAESNPRTPIAPTSEFEEKKTQLIEKFDEFNNLYNEACNKKYFNETTTEYKQGCKTITSDTESVKGEINQSYTNLAAANETYTSTMSNVIKTETGNVETKNSEIVKLIKKNSITSEEVRSQFDTAKTNSKTAISEKYSTASTTYNKTLQTEINASQEGLPENYTETNYRCKQEYNEKCTELKAKEKEIYDLIKEFKEIKQADTDLLGSTSSSTSGETSQGTAAFLLASSTGASSSSGFGNLFSGLSNIFTENMTGIAGGMFSNSALGGALISALIEMASASNTDIEYTKNFTVDKVVIDSITLESPEGVSVSVGEVTYDFDSSEDYTSTVGESYADSEDSSSSSTSSSSSSSSTTDSENYTGGVVYNTSNLSATNSTVEVRELTFSNSENNNNDSPYEPFSATLKVTASESVYVTDYNYSAIKEAAIERGEYKEAESIFEGWWLIEDIFKGNEDEEDFDYAEITEEDLEVDEVRDYSKEFHILFDSYEYVDCGPDTYACPAQTFTSCTVGSKTGTTGEEYAPKLKFNWDWTGSGTDYIDTDTCDEFKCSGTDCEIENEDYVYCDVTQFTIATLKKIQEMKNFFKTTSLPSCPQAINVAGTKTQPIETNALDVAVTQTQFKPTTTGATLEAIVKSNNQLEMDVKLTFKLTRADGEEVSVPQCVLTKKVISEQIYSCDVVTSELGSGTGGRFNVLAIAEPTLCEGCKNTNTNNDKLASVLVIGSENIQDCSEYSTESASYFTNVLAANDKLTTPEGQKILHYTNFKTNLVRDAFSDDFRTDFDAYSQVIGGAPISYTTDKIRDLFLDTEKFEFDWPNGPSGAWTAGKYDARIIIEFNEDSWTWDNDNNNIKKITVKLEPQGDPEPYHTIYNVGFNGLVGIEGGRSGYGVNYTQLSEEPLNVATNIRALPNSSSDGVSNATVEVSDSFYTLNNIASKGNVMTISRSGNDVKIVLSPSVAVPMILSVNRTQAMDAYAYYLASVDGHEQNELGTTFMQWTGIGSGCFDFVGDGMGTWVNRIDGKAENTSLGYGLRWGSATRAGTVNLYGTMYAPADSASKIKITGQSETATLETPHGTGNEILIDTGDGMNSIAAVIQGVKDGEICVSGGEYFWNSEQVISQIKDSITAKENTCIGS